MPRPTPLPPVRSGEVSLRDGDGRRRAVAGALSGVLACAALALPAHLLSAHADEPGDLGTTVFGIDPLTLALDQITPSVLTPGGSRPVVLTGSVTNVSDETWTGVNVAPFRSATPITSTLGLADAASTPATEYVGDRLTDVSSITTIDSLAPGESARFTARVPRSALGSAPGVYWIGVHAHGQTETRPRDEISDGRARSFLPVASDSEAAPAASLVLPVRARVRYEPDGTLADANSWHQSLAEGGQLSDLLEAGRASSGHPVSWLVDPAVLHAVAQLAAGNPGFTLTPATGPVAHLPAEPDPTPPGTQPSSPTSPVPDGDEGGEVSDAPTPDPDLSVEGRAALDASRWLQDFVAVAKSGRGALLALPYGDVDVAALSRQSPETLTIAQERGLEVLTALGLDATPAVAPPEGILPSGAVSNTLPETILVLADSALSTGDTAPTPAGGTVLDRRFVAASGGVTQGGPGPEDPGTAVAVRQRTLSEATVRSMNGETDPVVIVPPVSWDAAAGTASLVDSFEERDLRSVSLTAVMSSTTATLDATALEISDEVRAEFLPRKNVRSSDRLASRGALLDGMLTSSAGMDVQARDVALTGLSYGARTNPASRNKRAIKTEGHLADLVGRVTIQGPSVVTLSGSSGRLGATVFNGLDVPVTVDVEAESGDTIDLDVPNPVSVAPDSRNRLLLQADRVQQGVSRVTLRVSTQTGQPTGAMDSFSVRSSQVSGILWLVIGGGAAVLFGAIGIRFFRRGLASRREQGVV